MIGCGLRYGGGAEGIERLSARLVGTAFAPHRHDTYAIGVTLAGVQSFRYRGEQRHCLPGEWHVLHPDEVHDGAPGTDAGFGYRIVYIDPALVAAASGGALPFVADPVVRRVDPALARWLGDRGGDLDRDLDGVEAAEVTAAVADTLRLHAGPARGRVAVDAAAVARVRALLADDPVTAHSAADLERVAGLDRWSLARQFRAVHGTSPSRFRTLRRLDTARRLVAAGVPLAESAAAAGFADQSHLTRAFKGAYGITPGAWASAVAQGVDDGGHVRPAPAQRHRLAEQLVAHVQQR